MKIEAVMRRVLGWAAAAVLAIAFAGCSSPPQPSWFPCQKCHYRVDAQSHDPHARIYCVIEGREVDCKKNPPECPECRKILEQEGRLEPRSD